MTKSCDACAKRVNEVRDVGGAHVCAKCARDLKETMGSPMTMRSVAWSNEAPDTERWPSDVGREQEDEDEAMLDAMEKRTDTEEACPGCGSMPGDGITPGCDDPMGCGYHKGLMHAAVADTHHHLKHENAKFDGDAYMEETIRLEEARKRQSKAPVERESVGHIRQLRTQELPANRIRIGK
jgi:hypothetical protein